MERVTLLWMLCHCIEEVRRADNRLRVNIWRELSTTLTLSNTLTILTILWHNGSIVVISNTLTILTLLYQTHWQYLQCSIKHIYNTYNTLSNTLTILTILYQTHWQYLQYSIKHIDNVYNTLSNTLTIFAILYPPHWQYLQYSIKYSGNAYNTLLNTLTILTIPWHSIKRNDSILVTSNTVTILTIFTKYKTQYSQSKPHYLDLLRRFTDKSLKLTKNDLSYFCGHGDKYTVQ